VGRPKKSKSSRKKRVKRNPRLIVAYLSLMGVFIALLLFSAWCRDQSRKIDADIIKQTQKAEQLAEMQDRLKIELARLKSPRRISKIARNRLGLITPTPEQTIVLP
jgi:cell division protein FtsL